MNNNSFENLTFENFKSRASDKNLTQIEKIGFPDDYRTESESAILEDISSKLGLIGERRTILDIGCGCSGLTRLLIEQSEHLGHKLVLNDSSEMLAELNPPRGTLQCPGQFPNVAELTDRYTEAFDAILIYSVLQHVVLESNPVIFIDRGLELLKPEGRMLLGDLPNISKRNRFLLSQEGLKFHQNYYGADQIPQVDLEELAPEKIDDAMIFHLMTRYRARGYETYLLPQHPDLSMRNRREDLLIVKRS